MYTYIFIYTPIHIYIYRYIYISGFEYVCVANLFSERFMQGICTESMERLPCNFLHTHILVNKQKHSSTRPRPRPHARLRTHARTRTRTHAHRHTILLINWVVNAHHQLMLGLALGTVIRPAVVIETAVSGGHLRRIHPHAVALPDCKRPRWRIDVKHPAQVRCTCQCPALVCLLMTCALPLVCSALVYLLNHFLQIVCADRCFHAEHTANASTVSLGAQYNLRWPQIVFFSMPLSPLCSPLPQPTLDCVAGRHSWRSEQFVSP